ncbi:MAG TPA: hypothetical protein VE127_13855 [Solirubrobacteraceae bacterium]|nr:hypothetical protein [Solirubrobacteraceae bacterium]
MIVRRLPLAAAVAAGAVAAGCGSTHSDAGATQVKRTVRTALTDLAAGRGAQFCLLVTPSERAHLARTFARHSCGRAMHALAAGLSPAHRMALRHARVTTVTISGARATVSSDAITTTNGSLKGFLNDHGTPTTLVRQSNGRWLIAG